MDSPQVRAAKSAGGRKSIEQTNKRLGPKGRSQRSKLSHINRTEYFAVGSVPIPYQKRVKWCRRGGNTRGPQNVEAGIVGKFGLALHVRWHANRNRRNKRCKYCRSLNGA